MSDLPRGPGGTLRGNAEPARGAPEHSADWSDQALVRLDMICGELGCDPADMLLVMMNESDARANALNKNGGASGLIQVMPANFKWLGILDGESFRSLTPYHQLPYVRRYFSGHKGKLSSPTAVYMAVFVPAWIRHSDEPEWIIARKGTPIYDWNTGFDTEKRGDIRVRDLTRALEKHRTRPRYVELVTRLRRLMPATPVPPDEAA